MEALIKKFGETLSTKSLPTGLTPEVKVQVEKMLTNGEIEGLSGSDIPKSAVWMNNKINKLKAGGTLSTTDLIDSFLGKIKESSIAPASLSSETEDETTTFIETENDDAIKNVEEIQTIGKTLKSVINTELNYTTLRDRLNDQQTMVTAVMYGLSKAVKGLIQLIMKGGIGKDTKRENLFDTTAFGVLHIPEEDYVYRTSDIFLSSIKEQKLLSYEGFNRMMSYCVGDKSKLKHST